MIIHGNYFDGKQSKGFEVELNFDSTHLLMRLSDGTEKLWPFKQISVSQTPMPPLDGILICRTDVNARLVIANKQDWRAATKHFKRRVIPEFARHGWSSVCLYGAITVLVISAFITFSPMLIQRAVVLLPQSYMEQLEQNSTQQFAQWKTCNSSEGVRAMETLISPLIKAAELPSYTLRALKDKRISNAMVLPGGHIIVFQALIDEMDTAEELSGVLAHEIAHAKLQHIEKSIIRDNGISLLLALIFGGTDISQNAVHLGDLLQRMKYSRTDELEADALGYKLLVDAGMSPKGIHSFFEKDSRTEGPQTEKEKLFNLLRTHPYSEERMKALEALDIEAVNTTTQNVLTHEQWESIKNICASSF